MNLKTYLIALSAFTWLPLMTGGGDIPDEIEDYGHQIEKVCSYFPPTEQDYITFPDPVHPTDDSISELVIELVEPTPPYWRADAFDLYFENDGLWQKHFKKMHPLIQRTDTMRYLVAPEYTENGDIDHFNLKVVIQLLDSYDFMELRNSLLTLEGIKDVRLPTDEELTSK